jgi:N-acetylneuraminic acid mutarotase
MPMREIAMISVRLMGLAAVLVAAGTSGVLAQRPTPTAANPWFDAAPLPEPSGEVLGLAANGKLYAFAGLAPGFRPRGNVFEYDPGSNQWSKKKPMRLGSHHIALAALNNKIYVFGGFVLPQSGPPAWSAIDNSYEYDPATDEWKELPPMPTKRGAATAAAANGKIYITGGANSIEGVTENGISQSRPHNVLATVEEFDPRTSTWRTVRSMLVARNHHATASVGDKVYALGGRIGSAFVIGGSNNIDLVEMYDPATNLWSAREKMPTKLSGTGVGVYNNHIIVAGGEFQDRTMFSAYRAVEAYDATLDRWQMLPSMPHPRHGFTAGVVGNRFYAVSGDAQSAASGIQQPSLAFNDALQLDLVLK